jgi:hypothetical protein
MLFLISRIIAKKAAESGLVGDGLFGRASTERASAAAAPVEVDLAAIERQLATRSFPRVVPMTTTRWS